MKFFTVSPSLAPWKLGAAGALTLLGKPPTSGAGFWVSALATLGRSDSRTVTLDDKATSCLIILFIVGSVELYA